MEQLYDKNIKILYERFGITIDSVPDKENYNIEKSKDGINILRVKKSDRWIYLGSKYNQQNEIDKLSKAFEIKYEGDNVIVIGFGLGHHIRDLLNSMGNNKLLVFEPDIEILKYAAFFEDLEDILMDERVYIASYKDELNLKRVFYRVMNLQYVNNIKAVPFSNYNVIFQNECEKIIKSIDEIATRMIITNNTYLSSADEYVRCYLKNLPYIINGNNLYDLKDKFPGKTAVIVSSGPSLSENIKDLKKFQGKAVIISGIRNTKALLENGIIPDLICVIDIDDLMYTFGKEALDKNIPFVILEQANYKVVKYNFGENIFCTNLFYNNLRKLTGVEFYPSLVGGSVAHLCLDVGILLGCNKIIFVGQDLAYTENKLHADIAVFDENNTISPSKGLIYVDGNYEDKVLTDSVMVQFRLYFEQIINNNPNIHFINATEGGAKIKGTEIQKLMDVYYTLKNESYDYKELIIEALKADNLINSVSVLNKMDILKEELIESRKLAHEGVKFSKEMKKYFNGNHNINVENVLKNLKRIENGIYSNCYANDLISYLQYHFVDSIKKDLKYKEALEDTEEKKGIKYSMKSIALYEAIEKSIEKLSVWVDECIDEIKNRSY